MSDTVTSCFVIMPFSKTSKLHTEAYWTKHYESFLKPLIEECPGVQAHRSEPIRGDLLRRIITDLVVSPIVVADITDHNSNVYWELGVRNSFKNGTVTIAQVRTKLPFDVSLQGTLFYHPSDHIKDADFRQQLKDAIADCINQPDTSDSHVLETITGRGSLYQIMNRDEALRRLDAVFSECDHNSMVFKHVVETCRKNQEKQEDRTFVTMRFRTAALELLVTSRYLERPAKFYSESETCMAAVTGLNDQLNLWEHSPDTTEKWFVRREEPATEAMNAFRTLASEARETLFGWV